MYKRDKHTAIIKGGKGPGAWLSLLQWLRLLVLSLSRINHYKPDRAYYERILSSQNHIPLEASTKTQTLTATKLTNMFSAHRNIKWGLVLLFAFLANFATAQVGPFALTGNDNVCVGQTKNYGVTQVAGSTYSWTISPGTSGTEWIMTGGSGNTITVQWLIPGTYTISVVETNQYNCSSDAVQIQVMVHELPVCSISGPDNICPGSTNSYSGPAAPPTGTYTYNWSISGNATISGASNGQTVSVVANNTCGSYTLTLVLTNEFGCSSTCTQTYNITAPPVVLTPPANTEVPGCQTQAQIDAAYATWLAGVTSSGGCTLTVTNDSKGAPLACGGSVTVTWTAKSPCEADVVKTATFTVTKAAAVTYTKPVGDAKTACDFTDQQALDQAIAAWVTAQTAAINATGGCAPKVTSDYTNQSITLCDGGSVTITWTITDKCETHTETATFTVTKAAAVTYTKPVGDAKTACDFTDQQALDQAIAAWVTAQTAAINATGGCAPKVTSDYTNQSITLCDGGSVTITWTITDKCETHTETATFTVTKAAAVTYTKPVGDAKTACDFTDQQALDQAIAAWVTAQTAAINATGGCAPKVTSDYTNQSITLCDGGSVTITWTITDKCETHTETATFTVTKAAAVTYTKPVGDAKTACDFTDQQALDQAIAAWVTAQTAAINATGGCAPKVTSDYTNQSITLCDGGSVTITWTITDKCETHTETATFTVTKAAAVTYTKPVGDAKTACDFTDQQALDQAIAAWVTAQTAAINATGGCAPKVTSDYTNQSITLCDGGSVTITWTITDKCETHTETATFTVTKAAAVTYTKPVGDAKTACDFTDQQALDQAIAAWVTAQTAAINATGGCAPKVTSDYTNQSITLCDGGSVTITWTITDKCETHTETATFTVTKAAAVTYTKPVGDAKTACDFTDQQALDQAIAAWVTAQTAAINATGGCAPKVTSDYTNQSITLCDGGSVTITWTITDKCETHTETATFTVTKAAAVTYTKPVGDAKTACDFTDQQALDQAIAAWVTAQTAAINATGGCAPKVTSDYTNQSITLCDGGSVTITWTITDKCETHTETATFTVTKAAAVTYTKPVGDAKTACDFTDQQALDQAIAAWVTAQTAAINATGGCAPKVTSDYTNQSITLCDGGSVTITWTITDKCETHTETATFTVTKAAAVTYTKPVGDAKTACDFTDQQALDQAIAAWVTAQTAAINATGGCAPKVTSDYTNQSITLCDGGSVTITWTITDKCETHTETATFTVTKAAAVTYTKPVGDAKTACDFTDQQALDQAIAAWVTAQTAAINATGGCAPKVTSDYTNQSITLCDGGSVTITWTITDKCETHTETATFTVTKAAAVTYTKPVGDAKTACDFTDQQALDQAIAAWVTAQTAAINATGGCAPKVTSDYTNQSITLCDGGSVTITWTITDKCETHTETATFTVTKAAAVTYTKPVGDAKTACDFTDQQALDQAIAAWVTAQTAAINATGGCAPKVTSDYTNQSITLCDGGSVTITWTITDKCETHTETATFTVTKAAAVTYTKPVGDAKTACDFTDQQALDQAIAAWVTAQTAAINATGGCAPKVTSDYTNQSITLCDGGSVTITWTITDKCETHTETATFTVTKAAAVTYTKPVGDAKTACDFTDQQALDQAIAAWVTAQTAAINATGGCAPKVTSDYTNQSITLCDGGSVTITWTITDKCETHTETATFTVTKAAAVTYTKPVGDAKTACDFTDQQALDQAIAAWVTAQTAAINATGGCAPKVTSDYTNQSITLCDGGSVTITWTITDKCETHTETATFTVTKAAAVTYTKPVGDAKTACDFTDQQALDQAIAAWVTAQTAAINATGGCAPKVTSDYTNQSITLCDGGSVTITWTITDKCETHTETATFTVTKAAAVTYTKPVGDAKTACDFTDQQALDQAIAAWVTAQTAAINATGGCAPKVTSDYTNQSITLCDGGSVTITWTITDKCETHTETATFTVTKAAAVTYTKPVGDAKTACDFTDQQALDQAIAAWVTAQTAAINATGGCAPKVTSDYTNQSITLCDGGSVTITWTITDKCETHTETATFTVTKAAAVTYTKPVGDAKTACDFTDQQALDQAIAAWVTAQTAAINATGGCAPKVTSDYTNQSITLCDGGSVTITWTITDKCETHTETATFTVTKAAAVTYTKPVGDAKTACDFTDQQALDQAIAAWVTAQTAAINATGGCAPKVTSDYTNQSITLCDGGSVTITWTITDKCETHTETATFTVTKAAAVTYTKPVGDAKTACDFTDQQALDQAIAAWVTAQTAAINATGGCAPKVTSDYTNQSITLCDGGSVTITWTITDKCETHTETATFTVTKAAAVTYTKPVGDAKTACDFTDQQALDQAIAAWVTAQTAAINATGGCAPKVTSDYTNQSITLCDGGSVTITWTITDKCETHTETATFTVTKAAAVTYTKPVGDAKTACDFTDQQALDQAIAAWVTAQTAAINATGGCAPKVTSDYTNQSITLCDGGSVTITWTITDKCETHTETATFTVTKAAAVTYTKPVGDAKTACDFTDQQALDQAIAAWVTAQTAAINATGGCAPKVTSDYTNQSITLCDGGSVTITWTITDKCETHTETATFTVTKAAAVTYTKPVGDAKTACDFTDQQALDQAIAAWVTAQTAAINATGGCAPKVTSDYTNQSITLCDGGSVTITWTITDKCETHTETATFTVTKAAAVTYTKPVGDAKTACDFTDQQALDQAIAAWVTAQTAAINATGGCAPKVTSDYTNQSITLCDGGSVTITWTITDKCETHTETATFTVTKAAAVTYTKPVGDAKTACDFTDQQALDQAIAAWVTAQTAAINATGGCAPKVTSDYTNQSITLCDGGSVTITWTITDKCETHTETATFTVTKAAAVTYTKPVGDAKTACDFTDQQALDQAIAAWVTAQTAAINATGGCAPKVTSDYTNQSITLCDGGSVTITWTITDKCETHTETATFTVTKAAAVTYTKPVGDAKTACDFTDQQALDQAIAAWVTAQTAAINATGGCAPKVTSDYTNQSITLCDGGSVTITWTITDKCETHTETATFTVTKAAAVTYTKPVGDAKTACDFTDQQALDQAIAAWVTAQTAAINATGGCAPKVTSDYTNQSITLCDGGSVTITWTITDKCETHTETATFTVTKAAAVTYTKPVGDAKTACDFTDQQALDQAIAAWVTAQTAAINATGGCAPKVTSDYTNQSITLCDGGSVTITWTITDKCETHTETATFTVTKAAAVTYTKPVGDAKTACDFTDQQALDQAIAAWVTAQTAAINATGGCAPKVTSDYTNQSITLCDGGSVTITWTITDKCETHTETATFTVTKAAAVTYTKPVGDAKTACDFTDQQALDQAIAAWVTAQTAAINATGGCAPKVTSDYTNQSITLCDGGSVTITWTITDKCETHTETATFTVTKAAAVTYTKPVGDAKTACDFTDQQALDQAIAAWVTAQTAAINATGGCAPKVTSDYTNQSITLCDGGSVTITWTITDKCETHTETATFTVTKAAAVTYTKPVGDAKTACDFTDQQALDQAIAAWVTAQTAAINATGGCAPKVTSDYTNQSITLCDGGSVTITWTITDKCETHTETATFTVTKAAAVTYTKPVGDAKTACDFTDQQALDQAIAAWVTAQTAAINATGGCAPKVTSDYTNQSITLCDGGSVTITWTITDKCETHTETATFTVTKAAAVTYTKPVGDAKTACDFTDQQALDQAIAAWVTAQTAAINATGGCAPKVTSDYTNQSITLCDGGSVTITWTITDKCETHTETATFTVTKAAAVTYTKPVGDAKTACDFTDQQALDQAIAAWVTAQTAAINATGGCAPKVTSDYTNQSITLCDGGSVTITWTITDKCETHTETATFTVTKAAAVTYTKPVGDAKTACDFTDQQALDQAIAAWVTAQTAAINATGGCAPKVTSDYTNQSITLCDGGSVTITWTITDKCETHTETATFTVTKAAAVTYTKPVGDAKTACDFTDQQALDQAIAAWVTAQTAAINATGGCAPKVTSDYTNQSITLCDGGSVTITWTITDKCETHTETATFTVTKAAAVTYTKPVGDAKTACDFTDQQALDQAIAAWVTAQTAAINATGGCAPKVTSDYTNQSITLCDGGSVTITWTITDKCETHTETATFTVTKAAAVTYTKPVGDAKTACDFTDQQALDQAIAAWVTAQTAAINATGGCAPKVTSDYTNQSITLCDGGSVTITWTITDKCETHTETATFTVTKAAAVTYTKPVGDAKTACDFTDQQALDQAIAAWVTAQTAAINATGGCAPKVTSDYTNQSITLCDGGSVTITWTITDKCETHTETATFTVTKAPPVEITCPPSQTFCEVADNKYTIPEVTVTNSCGKAVTVSYQITGVTPRSGTGTDASGEFNVGVSTITWTVKDACGNTSTCSTTVIINPLPDPIITGPDPTCVNTGTATYSVTKVGDCNTYSWDVSDGGTIIGSKTGSSIVVEWTTTGTKTVTVTETMCGTGCTKTVTKNITVNPKPVTTPITHD